VAGWDARQSRIWCWCPDRPGLGFHLQQPGEQVEPAVPAGQLFGGYTASDTDQHDHANAHRHPHGDGHSHGNPDEDGDPHGHKHAHYHPDGHPHGNGYGLAHGHCPDPEHDAHLDRYANGHRNGDGHTHRDPQPDGYAGLCGADSWEPNDTFETAYFVFPGTLQGLICPSTDVDCFRFSANQYDRITLELNSLPADYQLRLWNPDGSLLEQSLQTGTTPEQIVLFAPYTGSYRAEVFPVTGQWQATDTYELRVQVTSATPAGTATNTPIPTHTPTVGTLRQALPVLLPPRHR